MIGQLEAKALESTAEKTGETMVGVTDLSVKPDRLGEFTMPDGDRTDDWRPLGRGIPEFSGEKGEVHDISGTSEVPELEPLERDIPRFDKEDEEGGKTQPDLSETGKNEPGMETPDSGDTLGDAPEMGQQKVQADNAKGREGAEAGNAEIGEPSPKEKHDDVAAANKDGDGKEIDPVEIKTRNSELDGKQHPITGIWFKMKTVMDKIGRIVKGVFPEFESSFDAQLPKELCQASDKKQFAECNKQLKEAIETNPDFAKKFTPEQIEQIKNGDTPDGYSWHHNEEFGKMQLVNSDVHAKTGHTGGREIWGGGEECR